MRRYEKKIILAKTAPTRGVINVDVTIEKVFVHNIGRDGGVILTGTFELKAFILSLMGIVAIWLSCKILRYF